MYSRAKRADAKTASCGRTERFFPLIGSFNVFLLFFSLLTFTPVIASAGGEVDELKELLKKMEDRHQKEMSEIRKQIEAITRKEKQKRNHPSRDLKDRVDKLEKQVERTHPETGFTSPKKWHFDLGGELEFEFVDTEAGAGVAKPNAHFQIDQLYLYPKVRYKDMALFSADIAMKTSGSSIIEEAWVRFFSTPKTYVEAGLNDITIANVPRKTETEILIESVFYRDDDMGLRFGGKPYDWLYYEVSVTNGFVLLGNRQVSEDPSFFMLADRKNLSNAADRPYTGIAVGFRPHIGPYGKVDILPFYYNGVLTDADVTLLQGIPGYTGSINDDEKQRYGFNFKYNYSDLSFLAQLLFAEDGALERRGWFVQPSYRIYENASWQWFKAYELLYRYSDLRLDLPEIVSNTLTWDRYQHVVALLVSVFDYTTLKFEYNFNGENTGGAEVDNDEFLTQLEVKW
ncbi:MAG: hypothetical protein NPINA01_08070 [Nitrospinaceae bacterium]|nr:MAG: hypothetical protein NPINA01_08070 [Nitrospinaceae bacterium]